MGRAKSNMDFIKNEKLRVTTYHRRKKSLMKKATQLATLCDIQVCIIMSGPQLSDNAPKPLEAWSENPKEPSVVIQNFKNAIKNKKHRDLTVSDVLNKKPKTAANKNNDDDDIDNVRFWFERAKKLQLPQLEELLESIVAKLRHISVIEEDRRVQFVNFMLPGKFDAGPSTYGPNVNALQEDRNVSSGNFVYLDRFGAGLNAYGMNAKAIQENCKINFANFGELEVGPGTFDPSDFHPSAYQMPPPRPHDHSNPIGRFTNAMMTSDTSDFSAQFTDQDVSFNDEANSNVYIPYNDHPQFNEVPNFLNLSFGLANNVQNPNATTWYLSTEQFEDAKQSLGGFNG